MRQVHKLKEKPIPLETSEEPRKHPKRKRPIVKKQGVFQKQKLLPLPKFSIIQPTGYSISPVKSLPKRISPFPRYTPHAPPTFQMSPSLKIPTNIRPCPRLKPVNVPEINISPLTQEVLIQKRTPNVLPATLKIPTLEFTKEVLVPKSQALLEDLPRIFPTKSPAIKNINFNMQYFVHTLTPLPSITPFMEPRIERRYRTDILKVQSKAVYPTISSIKLIKPPLTFQISLIQKDRRNSLPTIQLLQTPANIEVMLKTEVPSSTSVSGFPLIRRGYSAPISLNTTTYVLRHPPAPLTPKIFPTYAHQKTWINFSTSFSGLGYEGLVQEEVSNMERESLLDELLGIKGGYIPRGEGDSGDKPIIVFLYEDEEEWHPQVSYILSELYSEIRGSKPTPALRELPKDPTEEKSVDSTKDPYLLTQFKFEGRIEIIDCRKTTPYNLRKFLEIVESRLKTGYLQGFGFVVFVLPRIYASITEEIKRLKEEVEKIKTIKGIIKVEMDPEKRGNIHHVYRALTYAILGIEDKYSDFLHELEAITLEFKNVVKLFSPFVPYEEAEDIEFEFKEREHYRLKVATFSYLVRKEIEKLEKIPRGIEFYKFLHKLKQEGVIKTEEPLTEGIIPDIIYTSPEEKAIIEIETLIGTGEPMKKIDKTVGKYIKKLGGRIPPEYELWIVLKPVSALIHYEEIKRRLDIYRELYELPIKVKVLVLDKPGRWELVDIEEFADKIRSALRTTKSLRKAI